MIKCPEHLKNKEEEIVKLFKEGKIEEGLKEVFRQGLAKVQLLSKCVYCKKYVKNIEKHKCRGIKVMEALIYYIPGLTKREAEEIWFAGDDAEATEHPSNLRWNQTFEIMKRRKLKWRK